jgi:hypothetical protein
VDRCGIIDPVSGATYVYCIVKASRRPATSDAPDGLPGAGPVSILQVAPALWLVTADVPLDVYGGEALQRSLADLEWVGTIALAHEAVVEHFVSRRGATVVPVKLFTMFSTPLRAIADIGRRRPAVERAMARIAGTEEWGIRVTRVPRNVKDAPRTPAAASGAAFLLARKRARDDVKAARSAAAAAAREAFEHLAPLARHALLRDDAAPQGVVAPLLEAAFLVPVRDRTRFTRAVRSEAAACARVGAHMTLTGPWPAYSFVGLRERDG